MITCGVIAEIPSRIPYQILIPTNPVSIEGGFSGGSSAASIPGSGNDFSPFTRLNVLVDANVVEKLKQTLLESSSNGALHTVPLNLNLGAEFSGVPQANLVDSRGGDAIKILSGGSTVSNGAGIFNGPGTGTISLAKSNGQQLVPAANVNGNIFPRFQQVFLEGGIHGGSISDSQGKQTISENHPGYPRTSPLDNTESVGYPKRLLHSYSEQNEGAPVSTHQTSSVSPGSSVTDRVNQILLQYRAKSNPNVVPGGISGEQVYNVGSNNVLSSNFGGRFVRVNHGGLIGNLPNVQSSTPGQIVDTDLIARVIRMLQLYDSRLIATPINRV